MRIRRGQVLSGLTASLTAVALLSACGTTARNPGDASTTRTSPTTATAAATTKTAIAGPLTTQGPRTERWVDLQVGDCLADPPPSDPGVVTVIVVDCATTHQAEIYLRAATAVNAAVADVANRECDAGFSQYTGLPIGGSPYAVTYLIDSNQDRTSSNPAPSTVFCLLQSANGGPLIQSARR
jgi:hypothetical protein